MGPLISTPNGSQFFPYYVDVNTILKGASFQEVTKVIALVQNGGKYVMSYEIRFKF